jgi:hypothetical protein
VRRGTRDVFAQALLAPDADAEDDALEALETAKSYLDVALALGLGEAYGRRRASLL